MIECCPACGSPDPKLHPVPDLGPHGRAPESVIGSKVDYTHTCPDAYHSAARSAHPFRPATSGETQGHSDTISR